LGQAVTESVLDETHDADGVTVALVQNFEAFPTKVVLYESRDSGTTWQKLADLPEQFESAFTIDVAPSDTSRIYVSTYSPSQAVGVLLVSEDRGQSWQDRAIPETSSAAAPYIAAVHPELSDVVFVRTDHWDGTAEFAAQDALLVSTDAGVTFQEVIQRQAKLLGFAVSPDGSTVLAGYGDPVSAGMRTNFEDFGVYKAATADFVFDKILNVAVSCLRWTERGVYVCTVQNHPELPSPGMSLGFAENADFTLESVEPLEPLLDVVNVRGPLGCTAAACAETWQQGLQGNPAVCEQLGAVCDADTVQNRLACEPPTGSAGAPSGGTAGGSGAGRRRLQAARRGARRLYGRCPRELFQAQARP
jgi:hypothetical protein